MISLNWPQVNTWRLSQHHLLERAERRQMLQVVTDICGLHAQLMSAAELSVWARGDGLSPSDVQDALWRDRTLVKTWAMRGTLHLLTTNDFPLYIAGLSTLKHYRRSSWLKYHGLSLAALEAVIEAVRTTLTDSGLSREQLAKAVAEQTGQPNLRELLRSGWGALLKPAAFQGHLCFGPSQGQNVTFVQPDRWLRAWQPVEPEWALQEIARHYLAAYGPATGDEFARWFGLEPSAAKRVFKSLAEEIELVDVEGWQGWALVSRLEQMQTATPLNPPSEGGNRGVTIGARVPARATALNPSSEGGNRGVVRLLPHFDPYTVALARQWQYLLPEAYRGRVYRPQGWISPVVLVDGRMVGIWEHDRQRAQVVIKVDMFTPPTADVKDGIEAEARRLADFWGTKLVTVFENE